MPRRRTPTNPRWTDFDGDDPPRPVPGKLAYQDYFDHYEREGLAVAAQVAAERAAFAALLASVRAELEAEAAAIAAAAAAAAAPQSRRHTPAGTRRPHAHT